MKKLLDFSIKHPISVLMYFALLLLLGIISIFFINASLLPQTKDRWIFVNVEYQGVKANEIRKLIAIPLEENLSGLKNIKNCESLSRDGSCSIKIELKWNSDSRRAMLETNAIIDSAMESLPEDCPRPIVKNARDNFGKIKLLVIPKNLDLLAASSFAKNELKNKFLSVDECAGADFFGLREKILKVIVDYKMSAFYNIGLEDIASSMNESNFDYPAGSLVDGDKEMLFKSEGAYKKHSDILSTFIKTENGTLSLKDIAKIQESLEKENAFCYYNGEPCIEVDLFCKKNKNPIWFSRKIKKIVKEINQQESNCKIQIAEDGAEEIKKVLANLFASSAAGILVTFALILFFFRSAKIAGLIATSIPFCIVFSFLSLCIFGRSANVISLTGITICIGMVVDNSIVAIESALDCDKNTSNFLLSLKQSIEKILLTNSASTITTIVAFVPIFFIGGIIGELFVDLGISVLAGMFFSLIYSFTLLPALCVLFLEKEVKNAKKINLEKIEKKYFLLIKKTNKRKNLWLFASLLSLAIAFLILVPIKKELQAKKNQKHFTAQINFGEGSDIDFLKKEGKKLSQKILKAQGVKRVICKCGIEKKDFEALANPKNCVESVIFFIECEKVKKSIDECKRIFNEMNLNFSFEEENDLICEKLSIKSHSLFLGDKPRELNLDAKKFFKNDFFPNYFKKEKKFISNKNYMRKNNLSPLELSKALKNSFDGCQTFPFYEDGEEIKMQVQYKDNEFAKSQNLNSLKAFGKKSQISLGTLGHWEDVCEESLFYRRNGKDAKIILEKDAKKILKTEKEKLIFLGKENAYDFLKNAIFLMAISFILLYCLLGAQTESFIKPLIYFVALPSALMGASIFLAIFRSSLNINSAMAFAALLGMSVNNSIILSEGGSKKFSSALITTLTSIASLIPFAIDPFNRNPQSSLALALCGGLLFSAAASFILIPNIQERKK
ncbi:MAG: efflux RND transporter permease subunit [Treponema sp.]|nr:efflux RND transporter permease subunit [Treponema sp.]